MDAAIVSDVPAWMGAGATATLIWYDGVVDEPGGLRVYQIAGPLLEKPPRSPHLLLAPAAEGAFGERLYRGEAGLAELRRFLSVCTIAQGRIDASLENRGDGRGDAGLAAARLVARRRGLPGVALLRRHLRLPAS